jgi:cell division protein FtsQ
MWANRKIQMALGIVSGLALLGACFGALYWLLMPQRFPVSTVEIKGPLKNATRAQIEAALPRMTGNVAVNFFAVDLAEVRAGVERLPWVRHVAVRRAWPGRLEVTVEEHVALARWGDDALVNLQGEKFYAKTRDALPSFVAPAGTAGEVARRYRRFSEIVAPLGMRVERVVLSPRHAWQLRLANGVHVMLGRDGDMAEERLRKFVAAYPAASAGKKYEYVDLRYPNGFALRLPDRSG